MPVPSVTTASNTQGQTIRFQSFQSPSTSAAPARAKGATMVA